MLSDALFQLGMDLDARHAGAQRSTTQTEVRFDAGAILRPVSETAARAAADDGRADRFVMRDGKASAGTHLIIDLYDAVRLDDLAHIEAAMRDCVEQAGATLLHMHLHRFEPHGVSGVAVLAESHISVHTWPERGYAAFDAFMCGEARPEICVEILRAAFNAGRVGVSALLRGTDV
jgi:S-adenosylmethionine decarboxylase